MRLLSIAVVAFCAITSLAPGADNPAERSAEQILNNAAANVAWLREKSTYTTNVHWTKDVGPVRDVNTETKHVYATDTQARQEITTLARRNDARTEPRPETWLSILADGRHAYFRKTPTGQPTFVHYAQSAERVRDSNKTMRCDVNTAGFLDGGIEPIGSVFDIAGKDAHWTVSRDAVNGIDCLLLRCDLKNASIPPMTGGNGQVKIWVDDSQGDALVAYDVEAAGFIEAKNNGVVTKTDFGLQVHFGGAQLEKVGSHVVARSGKYVAKLTQDGAVETTTARGDRTDVDAAPQSDAKLFAMSEIADGSKVNIDFEALGLVWKNGKPFVPADQLYDIAADGKAQIASAISRAKAEHKRVLIQWGGNWCSWCLLLHKTMTTNADIRRELADQYVVVHVDTGLPEDKNVPLAKSLGADVAKYGFPFLTVLDDTGKPIANQETSSLELKDANGRSVGGPTAGHDPKKVLLFLKDNAVKA